MRSKAQAMADARYDSCWGVNGGNPTYTDDGTAIIAHYRAIEPGMLSGGDWYGGREAMDVRYPYSN